MSVTGIDPATRIGIVALTVADLDRSISFYTRAIGLSVARRTPGAAVLGVAETPLLLLTEQPGALPWMIDGVTGLYHLAILMPTRADLGRWLGHFLALDYPPPGQGDHVVSEALYLRDPDGHGIEVYWDRPRETWIWVDGQVRMGGGPVDLRGILAEAERAGKAWRRQPEGTTIGHVHLQVGDIERAASFYHGLLGFDIVARMPNALFVSAGGYHHHLGMNTWHSQEAAPAPLDTAQLGCFTLDLPSDAVRTALVARLAATGAVSRAVGEVVVVDAPWRTTLLLHVDPLHDPADVLALAALDT